MQKDIINDLIKSCDLIATIEYDNFIRTQVNITQRTILSARCLGSEEAYCIPWKTWQDEWCIKILHYDGTSLGQIEITIRYFYIHINDLTWKIINNFTRSIDMSSITNYREVIITAQYASVYRTQIFMLKQDVITPGLQLHYFAGGAFTTANHGVGVRIEIENSTISLVEYYLNNVDHTSDSTMFLYYR